MIRRRDAYVLALVLVLAALAVGFLAGRASAAATFYPATVEAAPGSVSGTVDRLNSGDDSRVTISEGDATAGLNRIAWLKPNGDVGGASQNEWGTNNGEICVTGDEWCQLDDDPVHDGNTTYISALCTPLCVDESNHTYENLPSTDITIDSLTFFSVIRKNSTSGENYFAFSTVDAHDSHSAHECGLILETGDRAALTQAFVNYSHAFPLCEIASVPGNTEIWTPAMVNSIKVEHDASKVAGFSILTLTASGIIAQFDDSDFQVQAYVNFSNVQGYVGYDLDYEGSESMSETLELQVLRSGGYVTIVSPFLTPTEAGGQFNLDPARDIVNQAVSFRIIDTTTNEETGESFALDRFTIAANPVDGGGPGPNEDVFELRCFPELTAIRCYVRIREPVPPGVWIARTLWTGPGEQVRVEKNATRHDASIPYFQVQDRNVTVTVSILLNDGATARLTTVVHTSGTWILAGGAVVVVALILAAALVRSRKGVAAEEARKRQAAKQEAQYRDHAKILAWHRRRRG